MFRFKRSVSAILVFAAVCFAQTPGDFYTVPVVGTPGQSFRMITGDTAVQLNPRYATSTSYRLFVAVSGNAARFCWNGLPSWEGMITDTITVGSRVVDTSSFFADGKEYIYVTCPGHSFQDSMTVGLDSLKKYTDINEGYRVARHGTNYLMLRVPYGDTAVAVDTAEATARAYTLGIGVILPEGFVGVIGENYSQISQSWWCSADSAKPAVLDFTVFKK